MEKINIKKVNSGRKKEFYNFNYFTKNISAEKKIFLYGDSSTGTINSSTSIDTNTSEQVIYMQQYITELNKSLKLTNSGVIGVNKNGDSSKGDNGTSSSNIISGDVTDSSDNNYKYAWDPRLARMDGFVSKNNLIIPFATDTAASAYYDELFVIEKGFYDEVTKSNNSKSKSTSTKSGSNKKNAENNNKVSSDDLKRASDMIATNTGELAKHQKNPNQYGVASLVNPYCVTKLVGGLSFTDTTSKNTMQTNMYDIRDRKRFYDTASSITGDAIVEDPYDTVSINNPTTTNIIAWSNKDHWGRTPYCFQDFVFCKYWNIIPNNRLITFRKYAVPTYDNLNFPNMTESFVENKSAGTKLNNNVAAPIATVVSYFGGDSSNKLNDFLKFTTGTKWRDITADIHHVEGNVGSNPRALIDKMFENGGGFGGVTSGSPIVNAFLGQSGGLTGKYLSFGKFVGLLDKDGWSGHTQATWKHLTEANRDPVESTLYSNKIIGPVNRIQSVKARDAGIEFEQSFNLTCEYVARPIGGVNTKAAMLDILANCMEIASPEAIFWGGGYRFMIEPSLYPFKRGAGTNSMMMDLYNGKIFGSDGAISHGLEGLANFGKKSGSSSFEWSTVTSKLSNVLSDTVGAIGNMLQSISSSLFGESSTLSSWINKASNSFSTDEEKKAGATKLNNMFGNLNKMWNDRVVQESVLPSISGMKSLLSGEPTGCWHLTVGNPLNPILVCGNLICNKMTVDFGDELGPDDFPMELKVTYTIEHAMARDKAAIQSMFNRGGGKIYKLPDYIKSLSDYETKVDPFTGNSAVQTPNGWTTPAFMSSQKLMALGGAKGYQTYKIPNGTSLSVMGDPATTMIAKFMPIDPEIAKETAGVDSKGFLANANARAAFRGNLFTRKRSNN